MRRVWVVCVGAVTMLGASCAAARGASEAVDVDAVPREAGAFGSRDDGPDPDDDEDDGSEQRPQDVPAIISDAHAQFTPVLPPSAPRLTMDEWSSPFLIYVGVDAWRLGGSTYFGSEYSPASDSPFVLRSFASTGIDSYSTRLGTVQTLTARASFLPGYRFQSGTLEIKLHAGPDFMLRALLRPALPLWKETYGARASVDVWWEPSPAWMVSGALSATTIESGISGRIAGGWRSAFGWVGPELLATRDIFNTQMRAGAHLSGLRFGLTEWSMAAGYTHDSFGRGGLYGRLGVSYRWVQ